MSTCCPPIDYNSKNIFSFITNRGVSKDAEVLEEMIDCTRINLLSLANDDYDVRNELSEALKNCSTDNWDGYGAKPLSMDSYIEALRFYLKLPLTHPYPEVSVDPDGEIAFDWFNGPNKVFSVSIGSNYLLSYAGIFESGKIHGSEYFGDELPQEILHNLKRVFS